MKRRGFLKTILGSLMAAIFGPYLPSPGANSLLVTRHIPIVEHGIWDDTLPQGKLLDRLVFPAISLATFDEITIGYTLHVDGTVTDLTYSVVRSEDLQ